MAPSESINWIAWIVGERKDKSLKCTVVLQCQLQTKSHSHLPLISTHPEHESFCYTSIHMLTNQCLLHLLLCHGGEHKHCIPELDWCNDSFVPVFHHALPWCTLLNHWTTWISWWQLICPTWGEILRQLLDSLSMIELVHFCDLFC